MVTDCQNVALAWLASKLGPDAANGVLRNLISCRVNKGEVLSIYRSPASHFKYED